MGLEIPLVGLHKLNNRIYTKFGEVVRLEGQLNLCSLGEKIDYLFKLIIFEVVKKHCFVLVIHRRSTLVYITSLPLCLLLLGVFYLIFQSNLRNKISNGFLSDLNRLLHLYTISFVF